MSYHTHQKPVLLHRGRKRVRRPKTFSTEEAAKKWAEENKIKSYYLVNMKSTDSKTKKIKVVVKA